MPAARRREQLLDVAKQVAGRDGLHRVSIESVAREAGITRPVVYAHFPDLGALLEAMLERESARAVDQLTTAIPQALQDAEAASALLAALDVYLQTVARDPVTWRLALMPPEGAPAALRASVARGREAVVALLETFAAGHRFRETPSPDPELTARALSSLADESARLMLEDPERFPRERLLAHAGWFLGAMG